MVYANKKDIPVAVLTSNSLRHQYFALRISQEFSVVRIYAEEKEFNPRSAGKTSEDLSILEDWFNRRDLSEREFFLNSELSSLRLNHIKPGQINSDEVIEDIESCGAKFIAVFGSSIIRQPLIGAFQNRIVNMHLGLSPYYRGSGTNFWPFFDSKLEYVGTTIHLIEAGVDSGPIIHQCRPTIEEFDSPHTIGCKAILMGTELMIKSIEDIANSKGELVTQTLTEGKVVKRRDFNAASVRKVCELVDQGLISNYANSGGKTVTFIP